MNNSDTVKILNTNDLYHNMILTKIKIGANSLVSKNFYTTYYILLIVILWLKLSLKSFIGKITQIKYYLYIHRCNLYLHLLMSIIII